METLGFNLGDPIERRLFLKTTAGLAMSVAALMAHVAGPFNAKSGPNLLRYLPGTDLAITPVFADRLDKAFYKNWPGEARAHRVITTVMDISEARFVEDNEYEQQQAAQAVVNVHQAIRWMRDRHYSEVFQYADQVHGQRITAPCGCVIGELFDHYDRENPNKILYPHKAERACEQHKSLWKNDWLEHYRVVKSADRPRLV